MSDSDLDKYKRAAAERALDYVESGMVLGLGSGSTAGFMLRELAERLREGQLHDIVGVATSDTTMALARQLRIPLTTLEAHPQLDLALDGADEIDPQINLVKGMGGALLREKVVASAARRFIVLADATKLVQHLGQHVLLPVEVIRFAQPVCERALVALGATIHQRHTVDGSAFVTDEGNYILDCRFADIPEPETLNAAIHAIPGVVEHGLFLSMASLAVVAGPDGVTLLERPTAA